MMQILKTITLALIILLMACNPNLDPMEGVTLKVDTRVANSSVSMMFVDAVTGEPITSDIRVSISGEGSDNIYDISGLKQNAYTAKNGFLTLAIISLDEISQSNKINFVIEGDIAGYIPISRTYSFDKESHEAVQFKMINIENPDNLPEGIEMSSESGQLIDGVVQDTIKYSLHSSSSNTNMDITIPAGMVMKDANGVTLSGNIAVSTIYFNNEDDEALSAFPGGLNMTLKSASRAQSQGLMTTCGFTKIDIVDESGRQARFFSQGAVNIKMEVPAATLKPDGNQVMPGDELISISRQEGEDAWDDEDEEIIMRGPLENGNLYIEDDITHLSYHNWGWFKESTCEKQTTELIIKSETLSQADYGQVNYEIRNNADQKLLKKGLLSFYYNTPITIPVFEGPEVKLIIKNGDLQNCAHILDSLIISDMCSDVLEINMPTIENVLPEVRVVMEGTCASNPDLVVQPSLGFWYLNLDDPCASWQQAYMEVGEVSLINVSVGATYQVNAYIDDELKSNTVTVNSDSTEYFRHIALPASICDMIGI